MVTKTHKYNKGHEVGLEGPLSSLRKNTKTVIRKADKGGGLVIQERDHYKEEVFRLAIKALMRDCYGILLRVIIRNSKGFWTGHCRIRY